MTVTLVTFAVPTVPDPLLTAHVSPVGCVLTVTLYLAPEANAVANANVLFVLTVCEIVPLSSNITELPAVNPDTVPPMVYVVVCACTPGVSVTVIDSLIVGIVTVKDGGAGGGVLLPAPWRGIDCVKFDPPRLVLVTLLRGELSVNVIVPFGAVPDGAR